MGRFRDADEVRRYVGGIFEDALRDPELAEGFARTGVNLLRLRMREPDMLLLVDPVAGTVSTEDDGRKPTVEITAPADVAHRFWLGKVNIALALARGEMRAKGPIDKIIRLVPLTKKIFPRYRDMLARAGRNDLADG